ncbi:MAG: HAMP domain-containing sensor histidine kinase [Gammaproteobacteria bacterium]
MKGGLRRRLFIALLAYVAIVTVVVVAHGYIVNERAERLVWESLLRTELAHFTERRAAEASSRWSDTDALRLYGPLSGVPVPPEFAGLPPGLHDEVLTSDGEYVVFVEDSPEGPSTIALEISGVESGEVNLGILLAGSTLPVIALLVLIAHLGAGWLMRPLSSMANALSSLAPDRSGQRLPVDASAPREAQVITEAFNRYLERLDQSLERERTFLNMASHELRTPIAVIASSVEVEIDRRGGAAEPYLAHLLNTARDMERLVSMLVALAKDPARLRGSDEPVVLAELIPSIVADHGFLAKHKELSFEIELDPACTIVAPAQVARAAIGNLVRNAIENSDRGVIRIAASRDAKITIADPGHGMTDEEMSAAYTRLARSGEGIGAAGAGIGLELISRLCEHLGWRLAFNSERNRGTTATLDFQRRSNPA